MTDIKLVSFLDYTLEEAGRLWHGDHRIKSIRKAEKFSQFADYSTRSIADYKPRHIHNYLDHLTEGLWPV
jgi:endo-1,4-beta-mannosidase